MKLSFTKEFMIDHITKVTLPYWESRKEVLSIQCADNIKEWSKLSRWERFWSMVSEEHFEQCLRCDLKDLNSTIDKCKESLALISLDGVIDPVVLDQNEMFLYRI